MSDLFDPTRAPGFKCPQCGALVEVSLDSLLLGTGSTCGGCNTVFRMDRHKSEKALELLQKARTASEAVKAARTPRTGG